MTTYLIKLDEADRIEWSCDSDDVLHAIDLFADEVGAWSDNWITIRKKGEPECEDRTFLCCKEIAEVFP